jgi:hypothetical protein
MAIVHDWNWHVCIRMSSIASSMPEIHWRRFSLKHGNLKGLGVMAGAQRDQEARVCCHNGRVLDFRIWILDFGFRRRLV